MQGPSTTPSVRSPSGDTAAETGDDPDRFQCDGCAETFQEDFEAVSLYECAEYGTRFTRDTSAHNNHQCPDCNKFAGKVSDFGCPECNEGPGHSSSQETSAFRQMPPNTCLDKTCTNTTAHQHVARGKAGVRLIRTNT
jgi:hypothetical protein